MADTAIDNNLKTNSLTAAPARLSLAFWNCNGIVSRNKQAELAAFAAKHHLAILMLGETHLQPKHRFSLPGYVCYRSDRSARLPNANPGGGTAVLVRRDIAHHELALPQLQYIEATAVAVRMKKGPLRIISAYIPPARNASLEQSDFDALLEPLARIPTLLAGDFNAKHPSWNSRITSPRGRQLKNFAETHGYEVIGPMQPTHFPANARRPDVLDIAVIRDLGAPIHLTTACELSSDHLPVIAEIGRSDLQTSLALPPARKRTNWPLFQKELEKRLPEPEPISDPQQIEPGAKQLAEAISDSLNAAAFAGRNEQRAAELPPRIIALIQRKNVARREWQRTRHPADKLALNQLRRRVDDALTEHRNSKWGNLLRKLKPEDSSLWQLTRTLTKSSVSVPPLRNANGDKVEANEEKAELFADSLESQFQPVEEQPPAEHAESVHCTVAAALHAPADEPELTDVAEVADAIAALRSGKAPGPDGIRNEVLKRLSQSAINYIVCLFNAIFIFQLFPAQWKHAHVLNFPKPGKNKSLPQSYRPISLLNTLGKLFEKILLKRILKFTEKHGLINNEQFGFRAHHSTTHQLVRIVDRIRRNFNERRFTGGVFLDVASAFDKVWHDGLLAKLIEANFPSYIVRLVHSFLANRSFQVTVLHAKSSTRRIRAGVPQGSIISPVLYCLYVRDIPTSIQTELAMYADDTAVIATSKRIDLLVKYLDLHLLQIQEWLQRWRIKVNVEKSTAVLFTRRYKYDQPRPLALCNSNIEWRASTKYLGITLDRALTFREHADAVASKAWQRLGMLRSLLHKRSKLSTANALLLYKAMIRPIMDYACPSWGIAAHCHLNKLQIVQNACLRRILCAPMFIRIADLHAAVKLPLLEEHFKNLAENFFSKINTSNNDIILNLNLYEPDPTATYKRPRDMLQ